MKHRERHRTHRIAWLRAAVLGANDGIVSTGSLITGVAAANASREVVLVAGLAGLVAGAMSMAAGEFVSVSSQADTERADLERERKELAEDPEHEHLELSRIYVHRGLTPELADQVATQLTAHDALGAHARDELGILVLMRARPLQAALASAATFAAGAALTWSTAAIAPITSLVWCVPAVSLASLALLGALGARTGGAPPSRAIARMLLWGALAMALTAAVGALFGVAV